MVELLVVIAIVAILAALLLPALSRSKARAEALMCLNNTKHLALAWTMYSSDNQDRLAYNVDADPTQGMFAPTGTPNWVNNTMDWSANPANTNLDFVSTSALGPYAGYSASLFHCPSDKALSPVQKAAGWSGRVRSVSMNAMVGDPGVPANGGTAPVSGYQQYVKESDFLESASSIFVFLDEHPDSINDGNFLNSPAAFEWLALPGSYHNGGGSFSFADGHAEVHRWHDDSTVCAPQPSASGIPLLLRQSQNTDFNWVMRHMTAQLSVH